MSATARADVVVVGGGLVGAATAYHAARRGARVILVDKGAIGSEQSGRAWGFVRRHGRPPAVMALMVSAGRVWEGLSAELGADLEFVREGNLAVAETPADVGRLEDGHRAARAAGLTSRVVARPGAVPPVAVRGRPGATRPEDPLAEPRHGSAQGPRRAAIVIIGGDDHNPRWSYTQSMPMRR